MIAMGFNIFHEAQIVKLSCKLLTLLQDLTATVLIALLWFRYNNVIFHIPYSGAAMSTDYRRKIINLMNNWCVM